MPFTPLHMGPAMLVKSLLRGSFSLMIFGWAQILMDIQPLLVIITGKGHLHGFSHTIVGAVLIAVVAALTGKPLIEALVNSQKLGFSASDKALLGITPRMSWPLVIFSAPIGTLSHVFLDAIMHSDLQPFYPLNFDNPLLGLMSIEALHKLCIYTGLVGAGIYFGVQLMIKKRKSRKVT